MPHTILLYEDNATIRELVSALLVDEGYAVREVGGLAEADALVGEGGSAWCSPIRGRARGRRRC